MKLKSENRSEGNDSRKANYFTPAGSVKNRYAIAVYRLLSDSVNILFFIAQYLWRAQWKAPWRRARRGKNAEAFLKK